MRKINLVEPDAAGRDCSSRQRPQPKQHAEGALAGIIGTDRDENAALLAERNPFEYRRGAGRIVKCDVLGGKRRGPRDFRRARLDSCGTIEES